MSWRPPGRQAHKGKWKETCSKERDQKKANHRRADVETFSFRRGCNGRRERGVRAGDSAAARSAAGDPLERLSAVVESRCSESTWARRWSARSGRSVAGHPMTRSFYPRSSCCGSSMVCRTSRHSSRSSIGAARAASSPSESRRGGRPLGRSERPASPSALKRTTANSGQVPGLGRHCGPGREAGAPRHLAAPASRRLS